MPVWMLMVALLPSVVAVCGVTWLGRRVVRAEEIRAAAATAEAARWEAARDAVVAVLGKEGL